MKDFFKLRTEEHGAGDTGTPSLVAKYKNGTPGQASAAPSRQPARKGDKLNAKDLPEAVEKNKGDPCWKGYVQLGMKKKGDKKVPNCVPEETDQVDEAVDKSSDVYKEYLGLKKSSLKELRDMIKLRRKVVDVSGYDKQGAISYLLRSRYGDKAVAAALGLKEGAGLDELSKATLGSYVKKAKGEMGLSAMGAGSASARGDSKTKSGEMSHAKKRSTGIDKAVDKLTKEEAKQVDELSQNTLRNYHGKSALDIRKKRDQLNKGTLSTADNKKAQKRVQGINRAANKMD